MDIGGRENGVAEDVDLNGQNLLTRETRVGQKLKRRRRGGGGVCCLLFCPPVTAAHPVRLLSFPLSAQATKVLKRASLEGVALIYFGRILCRKK